jgi:hypothetical protein
VDTNLPAPVFPLCTSVSPVLKVLNFLSKAKALRAKQARKAFLQSTP